MLSEQSNSATYKCRAAIYAVCAEQATSPEAAAALLYLEKMWLVIAKVADISERNGSRSMLDDDFHSLSPE